LNRSRPALVIYNLRLLQTALDALVEGVFHEDAHN